MLFFYRARNGDDVLYAAQFSLDPLAFDFSFARSN